MVSDEPNFLPPSDNEHDLADLYRRYKLRVRTCRKVESAPFSNQVVSDQLLGLIKRLRQEYSDKPIPKEMYELIVAVVTIQCDGSV